MAKRSVYLHLDLGLSGMTRYPQTRYTYLTKPLMVCVPLAGSASCTLLGTADFGEDDLELA